MTSTPFFKPIYRVASAVAMMAVTIAGQPATASLAHAAPLAVAQHAADRPLEALEEFISPADCFIAAWTPPDARIFTVPPGGPTSISVRVASTSDLNANTLQYQLYNPSGSSMGYTGWITITNFVQVDSKTIVMTATNVRPVSQVNDAFQSIQFRANLVTGGQIACSPVYSIFAATSGMRLPIIIKNYAATQIAPVGYYNNNTCQAVSIYPGAAYSARFAELENLFRITTLTTSTLTVTVSGFTSDGQIQLRRANNACGTGEFYRYLSNGTTVDPSVYQSTPLGIRTLSIVNVVPGQSFLRVVSAAQLAPNTGFSMSVAFGPPQSIIPTPTPSPTPPPTPPPYEPNNTACTAYPLATDVSYQAYPEDPSDWYSFTLGTSLNVQISMTNFIVGGAGQYILYKSDNCAALPAALTVQDKSSTSYGPVPLAAGKYFLRVAVVSGFQNNQLYTLRINTAPLSAWSPYFDLCAQLTGCSPNVPSNQFTVYWRGTPNMNSLSLRLANRGSVGSCPAQAGANSIVADSSEYGTTGDWTILNVPVGSYDVTITTTSSLGQVFVSPAYQVNINCSPSGTTWAPRFDICPQLTGCSSNFTGNRFTVYWVGTPNMNELRMRLANRGSTGSCPAAPTVETITANPSEWATNGDWEILTVPTGSYDMSIYTRNTLGQEHATPVFRVNINCTPTALAGASAETAGENAGQTNDGTGPSLNSYDGLTGQPMPTVIPELIEATPMP